MKKARKNAKQINKVLMWLDKMVYRVTGRAIRGWFGKQMIAALRPSQLTNGKLAIHRITYLGRY